MCVCLTCFGPVFTCILGGPVAHLVWGYIHFPLHLSLLLLTQCIAKAIAAGNVLFGLARYVTIAEALYTTVQPLSGSNTVSEWLSAVSTGDTAEAMNDFTEALGVNYTSKRTFERYGATHTLLNLPQPLGLRLQV